MAASDSMKPTYERVGVPNKEWESASKYWMKSRAIIGGQAAAKEYDLNKGVATDGSNLLVPFTGMMQRNQWRQYVMEAELPGFCSQFTKTIVAGLLRKPPAISYPEDVPREVKDWINNEFASDGAGMTSFLYDCLYEEITTGWTWITVEFPNVDYDSLTPEEAFKIRPYPVVWPAERVINWRYSAHPITGLRTLTMLVLSFVEDVVGEEDPYHPVTRRVVMVHKLNEEGIYEVQRFVSKEAANVGMSVGSPIPGSEMSTFSDDEFEPDGDPVYPLMFGEYMDFIPAIEATGRRAPSAPPLQALIDREIALYNIMSRRNHLMYGAATYTPYIAGDITDEEFDEITSNGLGVWLRLGRDAQVGVIEPPVTVLSYMNETISQTVDEMSRMGMRILSPEVGQSGIALEIRNSAQTALLSSINTMISESMKAVIAWMIRWRTNIQITPDDITFTLSSDFKAAPRGYEWVSIAADLYRSGIIPRRVFLEIATANDLIPPNYQDDDAVNEIMQDPLTAANVTEPTPTGASDTISEEALK